MCYYSFNYDTLILLRMWTKSAENGEINTWEHIDRYAFVIYRVRNVLGI